MARAKYGSKSRSSFRSTSKRQVFIPRKGTKARSKWQRDMDAHYGI
jgi:hypothetical protein